MTKTARISFSMQVDGGFAILPTSVLDVTSDLAERCGFVDEVNPDEAPSVLDAVVEAHRHLLGDNFKMDDCAPYLEMRADKWLVKAFGKPAVYSGFLINGEYACDLGSPYRKGGYRGLAFTQAAIHDGDHIDVFLFQDSYGMDYYTYFLVEGKHVRMLDLTAGDTISLSLEGLMYGFGGPMTQEDRLQHQFISKIPDAQLVFINADQRALHAIPNALTDEEGEACITFDEPGRYYLSAQGGKCRFDSSLTLPWLEINVS